MRGRDYANLMIAAPAAASKIAATRRAVSFSPMTVAMIAANTTDVSRNADPTAIGAIVQTHKIRKYERLDAAEANVAIPILSRIACTGETLVRSA